MVPFLLSLVSGCETGTTVGDTPDDSSGETGGDTGGENIGEDTEDETGETGETGDTAAEEPNLAWDVAGDTKDMAFSLVSLDASNDFAMADIIAETEAGSRIELYLEPPDDQLIPVPDVPGMYYAFFVGGLHEDDGDDAWDPDEDWYAASSLLSVYIDGIVPAEIISMGLHVGWNAMVLGGSDIAIGDPMAQPITIALNEALTVGGTFDSSIAATDRVTTVSFALFSGINAPALDEDNLEDGTWSLSLDGEPPASHFLDVDGDGTDEAPEAFLAFTENGADLFDPYADTALGFACLDGNPLLGWWFAPSTDIANVLFTAQSGVALGWNAILITDAGGEFLTEAEAQTAVLSTSCTIE